MGILGVINSINDTVKRNSPDLTPVKSACRTTYDHSSAAVTKIDKAVRVDGVQMLYTYGPQIGPFTVRFAYNAGEHFLYEGFKYIGGDGLSKVVRRTVREMKSENTRKDLKMKAVRGEVVATLEKLDSGKSLEQAGERESGAGNEDPKDLIHNFMMKEFVSNRMFDDLLVPQIGRRKRSE